MTRGFSTTPHEGPPVTGTLPDDRMRTLRAAAQRLHDARAAFLRERFDGYVEDTYHVEGVGYVCWPALADGRFVGYDDLRPAEAAALDPLVEEGYERLAVGLSRVALRTPAGDHVVKLARAGMAELGDGRRANLVEASIAAGAPADAPVVPVLDWSPRGGVAAYPFVADARADPAGGDHDGSVEEVRAWLADRAPWLDREEATSAENRCVWRGRLRTLDYSFPAVDGPLGLPDHVDGERIVESVDRRRRAGETPDLRDGGGYAGENPP